MWSIWVNEGSYTRKLLPLKTIKWQVRKRVERITWHNQLIHRQNLVFPSLHYLVSLHHLLLPSLCSHQLLLDFQVDLDGSLSLTSFFLSHLIDQKQKEYSDTSSSSFSSSQEIHGWQKIVILGSQCLSSLFSSSRRHLDLWQNVFVLFTVFLYQLLLIFYWDHTLLLFQGQDVDNKVWVLLLHPPLCPPLVCCNFYLCHQNIQEMLLSWTCLLVYQYLLWILPSGCFESVV